VILTQIIAAVLSVTLASDPVVMRLWDIPDTASPSAEARAEATILERFLAEHPDVTLRQTAGIKIPQIGPSAALMMAFPAEVGSIPRFLLLREFGLINTFWALVLPGAAHGFSIFILKGFFDGLAPELYEAAVIEGAPEHWMFRNVTLALTKPILAVTAFGAFTFALIVCPDQRMWTISVWLYQFQQHAGESVQFAALVLSSLSILAAFLFAQRFILQGIVLPVEK